VIEAHAFLRQTVDIGRSDEGVARTAYGIEAHLVGVDDQHVGRLFG